MAGIPSSRANRSMEREKGIEPSPIAWEAIVLPLNYSRSFSPSACSGHSVLCPYGTSATIWRIAPRSARTQPARVSIALSSRARAFCRRARLPRAGTCCSSAFVFLSFSFTLSSRARPLFGRRGTCCGLRLVRRGGVCAAQEEPSLPPEPRSNERLQRMQLGTCSRESERQPENPG